MSATAALHVATAMALPVATGIGATAMAGIGPTAKESSAAKSAGARCGVQGTFADDGIETPKH